VAYLLFVVIALFSSSAAFSETQASSLQLENLNATVEQFRAQLGISDHVSLVTVEANKRLVSVHRSSASDRAKGFLIEFDEQFLHTLSEDEQRAALAHELGHVWIFTHHPYLQTEALANEKALQLVPREVLENVYEKVWRSEGGNGTFAQFLSKVDITPSAKDHQ
jgi:hypothetical protein